MCAPISAIHTNRTVRLKTDYDLLDHEFKQKSVLHLDPHSWASYDLTIVNKTTVSFIILIIILCGEGGGWGLVLSICRPLIGLLNQLQMIDDYRTLMELILSSKTEVFGENLPHCHFVQSKSDMIGHYNVWLTTRVVVWLKLYWPFMFCLMCNCITNEDMHATLIFLTFLINNWEILTLNLRADFNIVPVI
jgi:hypothetical protein